MALHGNIPSSTIYKDEATLLAKVMRWLEPQIRDGIKVIRICDRYHSGYSDLFISARGRFVVAELKDDIGTATPHQEMFIDEMNATGAVGGVCRSVKDVQDLIDKALYCQCGCTGALTKYCAYCGKEIGGNKI
jgi:hypothetical protein